MIGLLQWHTQQKNFSVLDRLESMIDEPVLDNIMGIATKEKYRSLEDRWLAFIMPRMQVLIARYYKTGKRNMGEIYNSREIKLIDDILVAYYKYADYLYKHGGKVSKKEFLLFFNKGKRNA